MKNPRGKRHRSCFSDQTADDTVTAAKELRGVASSDKLTNELPELEVEPEKMTTSKGWQFLSGIFMIRAHARFYLEFSFFEND